MNHFDNADVYGNGRAERMLARVLKKLGVKTNNVIIATKVGHFHGTAEHAYEPNHIRHQCEQSLINLGRDYVDIYYFHHGNFGEKDKYLHPAADMMDTLVEGRKSPHQRPERVFRRRFRERRSGRQAGGFAKLGARAGRSIRPARFARAKTDGQIRYVFRRVQPAGAGAVAR